MAQFASFQSIFNGAQAIGGLLSGGCGGLLGGCVCSFMMSFTCAECVLRDALRPGYGPCRGEGRHPPSALPTPHTPHPTPHTPHRPHPTPHTPHRPGYGPYGRKDDVANIIRRLRPVLRHDRLSYHTLRTLPQQVKQANG